MFLVEPYLHIHIFHILSASIVYQMNPSAVLQNQNTRMKISQNSVKSLLFVATSL